MDKPQAHAAGVLCRFHSTYIGLGWNSEFCLFWRPVGLGDYGSVLCTFRACSCGPCSPLLHDMGENMLYLNTKKLLWIIGEKKREHLSFSLSYCFMPFGKENYQYEEDIYFYR